MALALSDCSSLKKWDQAPDIKPCLVLKSSSSTCEEYVLTDYEALHFDFVKQVKIDSPTGMWCFQHGEFEEFMQYVREQKSMCEEK